MRSAAASAPFDGGLSAESTPKPRRPSRRSWAALAKEFQEAGSRRELARVVGRYARTESGVLDELGYLALPDGAASWFFQVLSERHERGSLIVTTKLIDPSGTLRPSTSASARLGHFKPLHWGQAKPSFSTLVTIGIQAR